MSMHNYTPEEFFPTLEDVIFHREQLLEHGVAWTIFHMQHLASEACGFYPGDTPYELVGQFLDSYLGAYVDVGDFAKHCPEVNREIPHHLRDHIHWNSYGQALLTENYSVYEGSGLKHFFRNVLEG